MATQEIDQKGGSRTTHSHNKYRIHRWALDRSRNTLHQELFSDCCCEQSVVVKRTSGFNGGSYGSSIPVKPRISPRRALADMPFASRCSQISNGVSTKTSMNCSSPTATRHSFRVAR